MTILKMDKLASEILEKQTEVSLASEYVENLKTELKQFSDANFNLRVPVSQEIKPFIVLSPSQILAEMERLEGLENARIKKLENFEKTVSILQERIETAESDLKFSQSQLAKLEDEQDWINNFLPYADNYSKSFIAQVQKSHDKKVSDWEIELRKYQTKAETIERYLKNPNAKERTCVFAPMESLQYSEVDSEKSKIAKIISDLQTAIQAAKDSHELFILSINLNPEFRKFIRDRVNIQQSALELEKAQQEYLDKLEAFTQAKGNCRAAIAYTGNRDIDYFQMLTVTVGDRVEISLVDVQV